jgi:hypothetical protein
MSAGKRKKWEAAEWGIKGWQGMDGVGKDRHGNEVDWEKQRPPKSPLMTNWRIGAKRRGGNLVANLGWGRELGERCPLSTHQFRAIAIGNEILLEKEGLKIDVHWKGKDPVGKTQMDGKSPNGQRFCF